MLRHPATNNQHSSSTTPTKLTMDNRIIGEFTMEMEDLDILGLLTPTDLSAALKTPMLGCGILCVPMSNATRPTVVDTTSAAFVEAQRSLTSIDNDIATFDDTIEYKNAQDNYQHFFSNYAQSHDETQETIYDLLADTEQASCDNVYSEPDSPEDISQIVDQIRFEANEIERQSSSLSPAAYVQKVTSPSVSIQGDFNDVYQNMEASLSSTSFMEEDDAIIDCMTSSDSDSSFHPTSKEKVRRGRVTSDRKERKKAQNRKAAQRYREKKAALKTTATDELDLLLKRNSTLRSACSTLQTEIDIMRKLLRDVENA